MTTDDRASFDLDLISNAVDDLFDTYRGRDDLVGDVLEHYGDRLMNLRDALSLLAPYWTGDQRMIDVLKTCPPDVAKRAVHKLRWSGWIPWE